MSMENEAPFFCICGREISLEQPGANRAISESTCGCGRKYQLEFHGEGRAVISEPLTPEPRQPLATFSRELRGREDSQRFRFTYVVTRGHRLPVHILFSQSARQAEVATGDMKPLRLESVDSVVEARRRWIAWFESLRMTREKRRSSAGATWARESANP